MDEETAMIGEAAARILADLADPQTVNAAAAFDTGPLWQALEAAGLTRAWLPETAGGAEAGLAAGFEICRIAGHYACPVPLAETLLAGLVLAEAGLEIPDGPLGVAVMRRGDRLEAAGASVSGVLRAVPFAGAVSGLALVQGDDVLLVARDDMQVVERGTDMGDRRGDVRLDGAAAEHGTVAGAGLRMRRLGAVARAAQMTGALETALAITTDYAGEREAFGRKISKFQAVQQNLAQLAGEVAAALTASGSAADTLAVEAMAVEAMEAEAAFLEVASAKIRVGEAVEKGAAIAHQAMGAIGWTQEHILQMFTRRMFAWRDDFGSEAEWAVELGNHVAGQGADQIWPLLTTR